MQTNSKTVIDIALSNTKEEEGEEEQSQLSPYIMFKYSIRSELTRKYYERRLRTFFDFIQFEIA